MRINATGVGIGTGTFTAKLFVTGSSTSATPTTVLRSGVPSPIGAVLDVQDYLGNSLLVVSGSGNVGVGTTNPSGKLHAWTSFYYGGNATGRPAAGTGTALVVETTTGLVRESSSTRRVKDNIAHYSSGLDKIMLLNPVTFNFKNEEVLCAGFIAEDFADIPLEEYLLRESDGTPKSIRYDSMVALLTNGIKELKSEIDTLKIENAQLRSEIQFIKDQISNIRKKT
jgi:hypothetical protein